MTDPNVPDPSMPDPNMPDPSAPRTQPDAPAPEIRAKRHFALVWLIPLVAAVVAGFLAWQTLSREGPTITLTFRSGDGITAGQTKVRHKAVDLGTVRSIMLSHDMSHVVVRVKMSAQASSVLTNHARFWVVRPRFGSGNISGLETIVSGSYIEMDPGAPGGEPETNFTGLEEPPAVRSDEPGSTFTLRTARLGSLGPGSPVIYRDITVGEVLGFDAGKPGDPVTLTVFVRKPYDQYVREGSYFWNASGFAVNAGADGFHVELESLQAVLTGAVAFNTPKQAMDSAPVSSGTKFWLFNDENTAAAAHYRERVGFLVHFKGSVRGLAMGSPVELYGIQIGYVTSVGLHFDDATKAFDVPVHIEVQPERFMASTPNADGAALRQRALTAVRAMVAHGLRAQLRSASLLTGQLVVAFDFFPDAKPAQVTVDGEDIVLPSQPADIESITRTLADLSQKLDRIPFDQIGTNLNATLAGTNAIANGPELRDALKSLSSTLASARDLIGNVDKDAAPALHRLPDIAASLQATAEKANRLIGSVDTGYGQNSQFARDLQRLLSQVNDTARSVRILADFLDEHPEALIRGRTGRAGER